MTAIPSRTTIQPSRLASSPRPAPRAQKAEELYDELRKMGVDVLFDDRKERPGVKFNDADLLGIPLQIILGRAYVRRKGRIVFDQYAFVVRNLQHVAFKKAPGGAGPR